MEKLSLSIERQQHNGAIKLPPGFRFHPTDEELVVQYLRRKVFSCPLPAFIIPEIDLGKCDPWDLLGRCEQERYFFALRESSIVVPTRDWVLCRIFMKKRAIKMNVGNGEHLEEEERAIEFIDFMGRRNEDRRPSSPSDSDSSCVTEPRDESSN
ncbi:uncharacterized protein A4U43_C02F11410 [Asparagus officinalis]|uniref:NAC domain-containing protein n=1 Tax=Asparagus officinalis TaxID=4686 RepID=A0A5P1FIC9_ASPOF|nr:uncharacterized protein A4U43_C02F11410 [Asparagus officinalis]